MQYGYWNMYFYLEVIGYSLYLIFSNYFNSLDFFKLNILVIFYINYICKVYKSKVFYIVFGFIM